MRRLLLLLVMTQFLLLLPLATMAKDSTMPYVLMDDDLAALKSDFNAAVDQVRLVFIVGPT